MKLLVDKCVKTHEKVNRNLFIALDLGGIVACEHKDVFVYKHLGFSLISDAIDGYQHRLTGLLSHIAWEEGNENTINVAHQALAIIHHVEW